MSANLISAALDGMYPFLSEVAEMRRRARLLMESAGAAAGASMAERVARVLQEALATERVCVARYRRHACMPEWLVPSALKEEFLKYAAEEQGHAELLARRIGELGARPQPISARDLAAPVSYELDAETLADLIEEDLIAERIAIESYREMLQYVGDADAVTRELLEGILSVELGHAEELIALRAEVLRRERPGTGATSNQLRVLKLNASELN